ncbi:Potassium-transporting ATPase potassium-binding subunit [Methylacidimicrobium cyclopophantes]|uniref:Potassium-transporting ATPase potassium-binding subunit n=1 Tax=Methylacidimicrobium cyclopophantes TaxID=1041766 RepID=A0A5E6M8X5_9BACT|nr:potassium-transporting ATPase subunit KdpA [Methylacidimicrobium cyclopophantes]VVM06021.1 Potassium-transporting ATPase potassium-binding subunit [Methylacidimicrobium cyclopophantes]
MTTSFWLALGLFFLVLAAVSLALAHYLRQVLEPGGKTWLDPLLGPLERSTYRLCGIEPGREEGWRGYLGSLLLFNLVGLLLTYCILRLQQWLPLNPKGFGAVSPDLAFNTAVSFTTNTNWQNYAGESTLSYFSQMVGLAVHNFTSAASGIAVAAAFLRALVRTGAKTIGNFWVDLVRTTYYLLLPLAFGMAIVLVSQGVPQNFSPYARARLAEPVVIAGADGQEHRVEWQEIVQGPIASQESIKVLGTNGGGYTNANSAHPFENPTPLSNLLEILAELCIPGALAVYLGLAVGKPAHGWAVWGVMALLLFGGILVCWRAEAGGNPLLIAQGLSPVEGNSEGKEARFGTLDSALFAVATTATSTGAVNSLHDSYMPLGGLVPLFNMELGEVVFGGVGSGLYGMLVFVVVGVFLFGLMIGRTPEYLGKKIGASEVKMAALSILVLTLSILGLSAWAIASPWGLAGIANAGPHGLSEILYAFSSTTGNNGSAFAGLSGNTPWYNTTLGLAMLAGRYLMIVPVLALAGLLAAQKKVAVSQAAFPVSGGLFLVLLLATVFIVGALNFFPVLALGPILEHFLLHAGQTF